MVLGHLMTSVQKTILVVEDEPSIRETLQQILELDGYLVISAAHGKEALEKLQNGSRPNLILLDLMMPVMNGWEFMDHLKLDPALSKIPIVILSAAGSNQNKGHAVAVLRKPTDIDLLIQTIEQNC